MKNIKEMALLSTPLSRRRFVKVGAAGGLVATAGGLSLPFSQAMASEQTAPTSTNKEKVVWSACTVNCGSRCPLRMHVVDGEIKYVETDNTGNDVYDEFHQVRACLRGRSMRRRVYNPDRLRYPMKRVGKRGEGKFERISWDEAFDTISDTMKRLIKDYGNESIYLNYGTGTLGGTMTKSWPPGATLIARLMNCCGGYLNHYGDYSTAQIAAGLNYTYGGWADGNSPSDIENTKLVVMFGNNPGETRMSGGGVTYYVEQAREKSDARMIIIDPRYTDTGAGREDEWIPIRPGTDAALVNALAYVMIKEDLVDKPFLDKYCVGYDETTMPEGTPKNAHYIDHENVLFGDSTLDLREWMLENGIDIALTQNEPEDHFGLMVMMVAWVAETRPEKLTELLAEHLLPWAYRYLEKLSLQGAFPYYEGLAMLATLTLKSWQSLLSITPVEKQLFC
ncbi:molybdopterin-dependent oxidoreductase [Proteus mirabilis]|nr:molybdopterin-dependent oxidoreductase [Proteus mirabilis]